MKHYGREILTTEEYRALAAKPKRNKYGAKKVTIDGIRFDSLFEGKRYGELKLLQKGRRIFDLAVHPRFDLIVGQRLIGRFSPDFTYMENGLHIAEDTKSEATDNAAFRLRAELFRALYPHIELRIIKDRK